MIQRFCQNYHLPGLGAEAGDEVPEVQHLVATNGH